VRRDCPAPADLVAALDDAAPAEITRHTHDCSDCRDELIQLRAAASAVLASAMEMPQPSSPCCGEDRIADLAEGRPDGVDAATLDHLATCERCCHQLGSLAQLLGDAGVAAELRRLEESTDWRARRRHGIASAVTAAALAAAAALAIVSLPPRTVTVPLGVSDDAVRVHRESAITTTVPPRIVGPAGIAGPADSLRWTRVPHADRYQVRVFDRDGTLVWNPSTSDTVLAIPAHLIGRSPTTYLWTVEARTGWERWVASEWADLTIQPGRQP
jgi:hypothetical protein